MTTTTSYGTWVNHGDRSHLTVEDTVHVALGDFVEDHDTDGIAADYRAAINAALPDSVSLHGDEFYGPADGDDWTGYPVTEDGALNINAIVEDIDFWPIAEAHAYNA